jgi:hypothetical protein
MEHPLQNSLLLVAFLLLLLGNVSPDWTVISDSQQPLVKNELIKNPIVTEGHVGLWKHCYTIQHEDKQNNNNQFFSGCGSTTDWKGGPFSHPQDKKNFQMCQVLSILSLLFVFGAMVLNNMKKPIINKLDKLFLLLGLVFGIATVVVYATKIKSDVEIPTKDIQFLNNNNIKGVSNKYGFGYYSQVVGLVLLAGSLGLSFRP